MADQNNATAMNVGKKTNDGIDTDNFLSLMWSIKDEFISPKPSVTDVTDVIEIKTAPYRLKCVLNGVRTVAEWNCGNKECLISKAWWQKNINTSKFMISKDEPPAVINGKTVAVLGGIKLLFRFDKGAFSHTHPLIDFRVVEGSTPKIPIIGQNAMRYLADSFTQKAISGYTIKTCNYSVSCKLNGIYTQAVLRSESSVSYVHTAWTDVHMPNEVRPLAELNNQGLIRLIAGVPCDYVSGWILAKLSVDRLAEQALNVPMLVVTGPETTVIGANVLRLLIKNKPQEDPESFSSTQLPVDSIEDDVLSEFYSLEMQEELKPISQWYTLKEFPIYAYHMGKSSNFVDKVSDWLVKLDEPDYNGGIDIDSIEDDILSATPGSVCERMDPESLSSTQLPVDSIEDDILSAFYSLEKQEELKPISQWYNLKALPIYAYHMGKSSNIVDKVSDLMVKSDEPDYNGGIDIDSIEDDILSATPGSVCERMDPESLSSTQLPVESTEDDVPSATPGSVCERMDPESLSSTQLPVDSTEDDIPSATPGSVCERMDPESLSSTQLPVDSTEDDVPSATPGSVCEEAPAKPAPGATAQDEIKKTSVKMFLEVLVSRIFRKAKMNRTTADYKAIIMRLFERTWIEVQGVDFDPTSKTFKELDKAILQDLCKKWGSVEMVLLSMLSEEPELGNCIASSVKDHLMTPRKKRSPICKLFSSVCKAISNICRCRNRAGVI